MGAPVRCTKTNTMGMKTLSLAIVLALCVVAETSPTGPVEDDWNEASGRVEALNQNSWSSSALNKFKAYLANPPQSAKAAAESLKSRAQQKVASLSGAPNLPKELDVVVSGGGNFDGYYMGVSMILQRLQGIDVKRYAGASAGGMMPFEEELMSQDWSLLLHLSFGVVQDEHSFSFAQQVDMWNVVAKQICAKIPAEASKLNNKVFLALSCEDPNDMWGSKKQLMVSQYKNPSQAAAAYIGTGSFGLTYEGKKCSDGAATSGKNMTPLFHDKRYAQLVVDLMNTGTGFSGLVMFSLKSYTQLIQKGQDDMIEFLKTGKKVAGISLCPKGENTDNNICGGGGDSWWN